MHKNKSKMLPYKCIQCDSTNIVMDATISWSEEIQDFEVEDTYDTFYCKNCESDTAATR